MVAFDGARTFDWQAATDYELDALPTAPRLPSDKSWSHKADIHVLVYHNYIESNSTTQTCNYFLKIYCRSENKYMP